MPMDAIVSTLTTTPYSNLELSLMPIQKRNAIAARGNEKVTGEKVITRIKQGDQESIKELRQKAIHLCQENDPTPIIARINGGLANRFLLDKWYYEDKGGIIEFVVYVTRRPLPNVSAMKEDELRNYLETTAAKSRPPGFFGPASFTDMPINQDVNSDDDVEVLCRIFGRDKLKVYQTAKQYIEWHKIYLNNFLVNSNIIETEARFFATKDEFLW